jgi:uncharacterized protein (TIGR03066 family)
MRWSRFALAGFLVFGLALVGTAGTDTAKKLVGLWEITKGEGAPPGATVEFTKDGKLKLHAKIGDKDFDLTGTYKVEGKKLTVTLEFKGKSKTDSDTIKSVSDNRLVLEDKDGKVTEMKRVTKKKEKGD